MDHELEELSYSRKMSTRETAEILGVSVKTLRNWRALGKGPRPIRVGGKVLYREDEVARWERMKTDRRRA